MTVTKRKAFIIFLLIIPVFVLLSSRLFYLQVVRGADLAREAVYQRSLAFPVGSGRGEILDREGRSLVDSRTEYVRLAFLSPGEDTQVSGREGRPLTVGRGVIELDSAPEPDLLAGFPGDDNFPVVEREIRYGPNSLAAHLIGYVGPDDGCGLELSFNSYLGQEHPLTVNSIVDGRGVPLDGLGLQVRGRSSYYTPFNLVTTLDADLQQLVENVLDRNLAENYKVAAAVILDVSTGDILAMATRPDLDQQSRTGTHYNHALNGEFMPGSVFKTVIAAAALEQGAVTMNEKFYCPGWTEVGGQRVHCYRSHGTLDFYEAFAQSCNVAFIETAIRLGERQLRTYWRQMGFFHQLDVLSGSTGAGAVINDEKVEVSSPRQLANIALGQETITLTPLQGARLAALVANNGSLLPVQVVDRLETKGGIPVKIFPRSSSMPAIMPYTASRLQDLMEAVVSQGTASRYFPEGFPAAAKTGTAYQPSLQQTDSWFVGYYPSNNPKYALSLVIQSDSHQSAPVAAELAGELLTTIHRLETK